MRLRIPKKIDDQSLKDAVVEFRFISDLPVHILWGILFQALPEGFTLTPSVKQPVFFALGEDARLGFQPHSNIYLYDTVRLQITENALIFNIVGPYTGWSPFFSVIQKTLHALTGPGKIKAYSRIGLRYISEFHNINIFEKISTNCNLELPNWGGQRNTVFKTEIWNPDNTVVINLANKVIRDPARPEQFFSLIDIDVFRNFDSPEQNPDILIGLTNSLHDLEKETFFGLLTDEFLVSLNPQY